MKDSRQHLDSGLAATSLVNRDDLGKTRGRYRPLIPDFWLVLIGGSVFDAGAEVMLPLFDEIAEQRAKHRLGITVGGGVRERHIYRIGIDLGLPIGGLASIAGSVGEQNGLIAWACLAERGAIRMNKESLEMVPVILDLGKLPVLIAYPPYHYWEYPDEGSLVPSHGPDCGALMLAESLGCRVLFVKDVDGIHDADPASKTGTRRFDRIRVSELRRAELPSLPVEKTALDILNRATNLRGVHIVSARRPKDLGVVLSGGHAGTYLERDDA